jgi:hypothetical protein
MILPALSFRDGGQDAMWAWRLRLTNHLKCLSTWTHTCRTCRSASVSPLRLMSSGYEAWYHTSWIWRVPWARRRIVHGPT